MRQPLLFVAAAILAAPVSSAPPTLTLDLGGGVSLDMVLVKGGAFRQGSAPGEAGRGGDETSREVMLSSDYYIGRYEVTVAQWARFAADAGYRSEAERGTSGGFGWDGRTLTQSPRFNWRSPGHRSGARHPVTIVTYDDALAFANWLTRRSGRSVTLPTEAQWERAARGGTATRFYGGDADGVAQEIGWLKANAPDGPREVGQKKPNALGLYDTAGNVYEWCLDWYGPYEAGPARDPRQGRSDLSDKPRRVLRGGSWLKGAPALRSAARYRNTPGSRNADNGFRVVASVEAKASPTAAAAGARDTRREVEAEHSSGSAAGGLAPLSLLGALCAGVSLLAGFVLLRRRRGGVRTRIAEDGFTLRVPGAQVGQRLHYRYGVGGRVKTGHITLTGDPSEGVFVYTGDRPAAVELLSVAAATTVASSERTLASPDPPARRDPDEPFRGYPSAY